MSGPFGDTGNSSIDTSLPVGQNGDQEQAQGYNPSYNAILGEIPQDLHPKILPHLQGWDKEVQNRFSKVQPYQEFIDNSVDPEHLRVGQNMLNLLNTNPELLWKTLGEAYNFGKGTAPGQGQQQEPIQNQEPEDPYAQRFAQMEQNNLRLAEAMLQQRQQEAQAREDAALDSEFKAARQRHGEFDEDWVVAKCMRDPNLSIDAAAKQYMDWQQQLLAKHGAKPLGVLGGGGGVPGAGSFDSTKMNGKETRSLVAQLLDQANAQNR